jgi:hypothetical protein
MMGRCTNLEPPEQKDHDVMNNYSVTSVWLLSAILFSGVLYGQVDRRFGIELEGGIFWQNRNDVRVPNETGTKFSLVDVIGKGPYGVFRAEVTFDVNEKHGFRFVVAPILICDDGELPNQVSFAGELFDPAAPTRAKYKFSSYRFTYRYRFYEGATWRWKIGATGFVRDARIALQQPGKFAEDTDVGFVPLVHLRGEARFRERWRFLLDVDGLAASQGRAFDVAAKLGYRVSDRVELAFGYRLIEGGADVDQVFNFAWLNTAVGSLRFSF